MKVEIVPEPSEVERAAIESALGRPSAALPPAYSSAWRRAGLETAGAPPKDTNGADFVTNPSN